MGFYKRIILSHIILIIIVFILLWFSLKETPIDYLFVIFLISLSLSTIIGFLIARPIIRRIRDTVDFLEGVRRGEVSEMLLPSIDDEMGRLCEILNTVIGDMDSKMKALIREKGILETIFNTIRDGIMVIDERGIITLASPSVQRVLGIEGDIIGQNYFEVLREPSVQDAVNEAHSTGRTSLREIEIFHPQNKNLYITVTPLHGEADGLGFVIVLHDITKLRHLETVRKDFVANVSHELKTPITAIKGFAETLLDSALEEKEKAYNYIKIIKNHSERLNNLVEDLLTLSRLDRGEVQLRLAHLDIKEMVELVFLTLKEKAMAKGLKLINDVTDDFPRICADRDRFIQILLNLIDNAIKFTEDGEVRVKGKVSNGIYEVCVEDTGIGISAKDIPRLGERFYRVDMARSRALGGTGLGLAIVKHLVRIHRWQMRIDSTVGRGTKVTIYIPSCQETTL